MKRIICVLLVISLFFSISVFAFSECDVDSANQEKIISGDGSGNRPEETEWVIRRWNGLIQKRLWSITYGYWLTDWITIGYYDP